MTIMVMIHKQGWRIVLLIVSEHEFDMDDWRAMDVYIMCIFIYGRHD